MTTEQIDLSIALFNAGVFKSGEFHVKSGCVIDAYFDLLTIFGHPWLMVRWIAQISTFRFSLNLSEQNYRYFFDILE